MSTSPDSAATPFDHPWFADQGDGTYRNPILHADYSDPDVIRHGDDFWMTASSFHCTPGLPILHSRDLVNWELVGHAIRNVPHPRYAEVRKGAGVWAPAIRFHDGKFWIFFPLPDEGIFVTTAPHPTGPWADPWRLAEATGWIDPCPFWDDDGRAYLAHAWSLSRSGRKERIHLRPMSPDGRHLLPGDGVELFHTPHHLYLEGPKVHKIDGRYYVFAPGGGVATGWQVAFRADRLEGPYEERIVLEQGSTAINGPHQGAMVELANGDWWFVHFQDAGGFGRITHLQPVRWSDGWPQIGVDFDGNGVGEPVPGGPNPAVGAASGRRTAPPTDDDFDAATLGVQWQWQANHASGAWSLEARPGWLRLAAAPAPPTPADLSFWPRFLGQKFPARAFVAETRADPARGTTAGLAIVGGEASAAVAVRRGPDFDEVVWRCGEASQVIARLPASAEVGRRLRVSVSARAVCRFGYEREPGRFVDVPQEHGAGHGGWLGARVGVFCQEGTHADFDFLRFHPPGTPFG